MKTIRKRRTGVSGKCLLYGALLFPFAAFSQPGLGTGGTSTENYVQKTVYLVPLGSAPSNPTVAQAMRDITYYDGLGRAVQEIGVRASGGTGYKDVVTPIAYDGYGRQDRDYLAYATATGAGGAFKPGAVAAQGSYYSSGSTVPAGQSATAYASGPRVYEPSPLNRVVEQGFPGLAWQPAGSRGTTGRTVATEYVGNNTLGFSDAGTRRVLRYRATLNSSGVPALALDGVARRCCCRGTRTTRLGRCAPRGFRARRAARVWTSARPSPTATTSEFVKREQKWLLEMFEINFG
ncbi:DUF6443 domain-containing protein [Parapedobacter soli]|uniref:DUF6443 domain-containing protein n=1 Tax=Parapedobacter soli TaxID=416955 RepID=UPI0021CAD133|nr:DUF6443 domain-containing protein [Parapedobacter soli]